ncbi:MAG: 4Fe-4S dicluster domain-containing protein [Asgard group archaeon]|nr:4Fe-4S dicluster domain-containing protein [Asgard group archaeon]
MNKKTRTAPFLGALKLNWCDNCNLPILDKKECNLCKNKTRVVNIAPPGDIRPAFKDDIQRMTAIIDEQYGLGSAEALGLTNNRLIVLNEVSYDDWMDELIIDGEIVGVMRYQLALEKWDFLPRVLGAKRIFKDYQKRKKYLIVDKGAVDYIANGYNVLAPGVKYIDPTLRKGEAAVALSPEGEVLTCGNMRINACDLAQIEKGVVLKPKHSLKHYTNKSDSLNETTHDSWDDAVLANNDVITQYERKAIETIDRIREKYSDLPLSVSFSGGKDSLVCLNLATKIKEQDFKVLFVNTSLEFPETLDYIETLIDEMVLRDKYCKMDVTKDKFWNSVGNFGPPGKDYRYCCKMLKIGPVNDLIEQCIGKKTLSIIGQRGYESIARSESKTIWENPWIPNQINFAPIQKWTALHVFLYIFKEKLHCNPLYEKGLSRIGCWLCPATSQGTFEIIKERHKDLWVNWEDFLLKWQKKNDLPREWITWGLWRWKKLPKKMFDLAAETNVTIDYEKREEETLGDWELKFTLIEGFATCKSGNVILEGTFNHPINLPRIIEFWNIFSDIDYEDDLGILTATIDNTITIALSADGAVTAKGPVLEKVKEALKMLVLEVFRAEDCTGCEVCFSHCDANALSLDELSNQITIDIEKCSKCGDCHFRCPVVKFGHREIEELFS